MYSINDTKCRYCGDNLHPAHIGFGICAWCIKSIEDRKLKAEEFDSYSYSNYEEIKEE